MDEKLIRPITKEGSLRTEFGLSQEDKVILYSRQPRGKNRVWKILIEAAKYFKQNPSVKFVIVGSGAWNKTQRKWRRRPGWIIYASIRWYLTKNFRLCLRWPISTWYCRKNAADTCDASKLTSILAAGGCPLVTASQERFIPGDPQEWAWNRHWARRSPKIGSGINFALDNNLEKYRSNARYYANKYLSKEVILEWSGSHIAVVSRATPPWKPRPSWFWRATFDIC